MMVLMRPIRNGWQENYCCLTVFSQVTLFCFFSAFLLRRLLLISLTDLRVCCTARQFLSASVLSRPSRRHPLCNQAIDSTAR